MAFMVGIIFYGCSKDALDYTKYLDGKEKVYPAFRERLGLLLEIIG